MRLDNEIREEVKSFLRKALINLEWQEDETAIEHIREAYNKIKNYEGIATH